MDEVTRAEVKVPPPKILLTKYAKSVTGVNENVVATLLLDMMFEGYFTFYNVPQHDQLIEITNHGMATFISDRLLRKNKEIFWKATMNISMTLANIAVAVVAIIALSKDNSELRQLKDRLLELEQRGDTTRETANPKIEQTQHSNQTSSTQTDKTQPSFRLDTFYIGVDTIYNKN